MILRIGKKILKKSLKKILKMKKKINKKMKCRVTSIVKYAHTHTTLRIESQWFFYVVIHFARSAYLKITKLPEKLHALTAAILEVTNTNQSAKLE